MAELSTSRVAAVAAVVGALATGLAACGGSSASHVASLAKESVANTGSSTTHAAGSSTKLAREDPTRLADEWASCMRHHGDPNQPDPVIDAHGVINIVTPPMTSLAASGSAHAVAGSCSEYLAAAQRALRAADPVPDPLGMTSQTDLLKYVACMRAEGVPNYPYPSGPNDSETNFNGTGVDPTSPPVVKVSIKCGNQLRLPLWWSAGWGPPGDVSVSTSLPPGSPQRAPAVPATGASSNGLAGSSRTFPTDTGG